MLILPVGEKEGHRAPPWVCIFLIILNTLVYAICTHQDHQLDDPFSEEQANILAEYESGLLLEWLAQGDARTYSDALAMGDRGPDFMWQYGWFDQAFAQVIHAHWQQQPPTHQWQELRSQLEEWTATLSTFRWGLTPNSTTPTTLLSSMFMHGDWFHLLGNMVWLIIFGIAMERYWGSRRFLGAYLLSGIGAGVFYVLLNQESGIPLVGASGAISGLMGLYAGTYRLKKLEFFYTLGFLFGSFKAPALVLFPVWLGWELVQSATVQSNVAYLAHAGGLISGVLIAAALPWTGQPRHQRAGSNTDSNEREVPESCLQLAEQLRFDEAGQRCRQLLEQHPQSRPLLGFFLLMGLRQQQLDSNMKDAMKKLNTLPASAGTLWWLWEEFERLGGDVATLPPPFRLLLAELAWKQKQVAKAKALVANLQQQQWQHPRLDKLSAQIAGC
ncbi:hypothetical protein Q670_04430 [Alcanivorax sp. P2S70]|uniref:rhomboid family intramembrane serine protease n=1 Tax=Alcanivorax TaxID=59753 RepID=UPI0003B52A9A|nr:rhomboid family intramembrane serine protease [Alcanivorax sp. P2S70]ERP88892.1 hypothetical protein Q670_04430 [Alcanivorax sp. P2S70]|tara:strand:- start:129 stop:1457 length:1329 start_codon:yes stop_codon:yes gene_type:complete